MTAFPSRRRRAILGVALLGGLSAGAATLGLSSCGTSASVPYEGPPVGAAVTVATAGAYAGSDACAECHTQEYEAWRMSRHSTSLRKLTPELDGEAFAKGNRLVDAARGITYQAVMAKEGPAIKLTRKSGANESLPMSLAMGSGRVAITYIPWNNDGSSLNSRITHYRAHGWDWTPKQEPTGDARPDAGIPVPPSQAAECFTCHSTRLVADEQKRLMLDRSELGVGCERCHGAGQAHIDRVRSKSSGRTRGTLLLNRSQVLKTCDTCHSAPSQPLQPDHDPEMPRFKATAFALSGCAKARPDFTCVSCHDPHERLSENGPRYDATCISCHTAGQPTGCKQEKTKDCVTCHMPHKKVPPNLRVSFTQHWIRVNESPPTAAGH